MESRLVLGNSNEDCVYDNEKCIICQKKSKTPLSSTENGRQKIIDAANKRRMKCTRDWKVATLRSRSNIKWTMTVTTDIH